MNNNKFIFETEARTAINPRTKATVNVPATTVPSLKFGKTFKEAL